MLYNAKGTFDYNSLVKEHLPLVKKIASGIYKKINFMVELDDLVQCGTVGLIEALQKYVPDNTAKFETYATTRIRGAILDELRKNDHLSQEDRQLYKTIENSAKKLENKLSRRPTTKEVIESCGISTNDYFEVLNKNQTYSFISMHENEECLDIKSEEESIEEKVSQKEMLKLITKKISELSEKEQIVMQLIYVEDLDSKEVAYVMKITPARVSQIHSQAIQRLKNSIK